LRVWDSQGDFKISQFKSPIIITSLFSISLFLKKASYSSKRADCELGALLYTKCLLNHHICQSELPYHIDLCSACSLLTYDWSIDLSFGLHMPRETFELWTIGYRLLRLLTSLSCYYEIITRFQGDKRVVSLTWIYILLYINLL
jgi:hypothetical protein